MDAPQPIFIFCFLAVIFLAVLALLRVLGSSIRHHEDLHALKARVEQLRTAQLARLKAAVDRRGTADVDVVDDGLDVDVVPDDGFDVDVVPDDGFDVDVLSDAEAAKAARSAA